MPNIKSAKKRMHLSRQAATKNRAVRSRIRTAVKKVREAEGMEDAQVRLAEAVALLDRAARTRLVPPNRVARVKSQLQLHVNGLKSG